MQQEGYEVSRFLVWLIKHPFQSKITTKKPLVWTKKVKNILIYSIIFWIIGSAIFFTYFQWLALVILLLGLWQPSIFLILGLTMIKPYEIFNRWRVVNSSRKFFNDRIDIKIIGITGSYGKTSVKDFLFEIIRDGDKVVKTPESFNTVFGIKKVIDYEITTNTKLFLCEMGAYTRGEIAELCKMVPPDFALLTAIGSQHLERFGNLQNTTLGKFELVDAVDPKNALVNLDNELIARRITLEKYKGLKTYSLENKTADFYTRNRKIKDGITSFELIHKDKEFSFRTRLFGSSNLSNLVGAIGMALMLKVPYKQIKERVSSISPSPHRLELKKIGESTLIDDAFSSNEQGFENLISDIKQLEGKKVIITPGIVELGHKTAEVHNKLGHLISEVFDLVYLVDESERTKGIIQGLEKKTPYVVIKNGSDIWKTIDKLASDFDWIVIENDLTDIY